MAADTVWRVFRRERRAQLRGLLTWLLPIAAMLGLMIALAPSMARQGGVLEAKLATMPEGLRKAFGMAGIDFTRPAGYLAMSFVYVTLTAALSAGMLGATLLAKEEALHTAELLLTLPVRRRDVVAGKACALLLHVIAFNGALAAFAIGGLAAVVTGPIEAGRIASLFGGTAALAVCFGGAGMLVATVVPRPRDAGNAALGVVLGAYLVSLMGVVAPQLDRIAALSPFHWVAPARILMAGGLDPVAIAALLALGAAAGALAVVRYERRDILA